MDKQSFEQKIKELVEELETKSLILENIIAELEKETPENEDIQKLKKIKEQKEENSETVE